MHDRVIPSTNRAFEKPIESTKVGPGIGQGYSSLPIGGYQQMEVLDIARRNLSVDELRASSNPKVTYEGTVIPGQAIGTQRGDIGEVRKYHPDRFFMNEGGERNFVSAPSDITRETARPRDIGAIPGSSHLLRFHRVLHRPLFPCPLCAPTGWLWLP
jgi:hypothetical protein